VASRSLIQDQKQESIVSREAHFSKEHLHHKEKQYQMMISDQKTIIDDIITMPVSSTIVILSRIETVEEGRRRMPIMNKGKVMRLGTSARDGKGFSILFWDQRLICRWNSKSRRGP